METLGELSLTGEHLLLLALFLGACLLCGLVGAGIGRLVGKGAEGRGRKDAVRRSKAVISGQVVEQLAPLLPGFPCHLDDVKFLGQPIDYIAFVSDKKTGLIDEVVFIEVKTGRSGLSSREKSLRNAVEQGRVRYVEWRRRGEERK